ncbi:MAG: hypothetical protein ACPHRO_15325, partial [Nannocystaceae bacterium]
VDLELDEEPTRYLVAACMLHDVGHFPLSHAAESAFRRRCGANHHELGRWIVHGDGPIPRASSLAPILERADLAPTEVWSIIDPRGPSGRFTPLAPLLSAAINLDTLDGIPRVARTFRRRALRDSTAPIFGWSDGALTLRAEALPHLDSFWRSKDLVYDQIINLPSNILAEAQLCDVVDDAFETLTIEDILELDDPRFHETLAARGDALAIDVRHDQDFALRDQAGWGQIVIRNRKRYAVHEDVEPSPSGLAHDDWGRRYRHTKGPAYLVARREQLELPGLRTLELERPDL